MSRTLLAAVPVLLLCMACECRDVRTHRGIPDRLELTLWGMADEPADPLAGLDIWGEGRYAVDVDLDDRRSATLSLGSGQMDIALQPPDEEWVSGDASGLPIVVIELAQAHAPDPGSKRTLVQGDFDAIRVRAVIDGAVFEDADPDVDVAFDLATGVTEVSATGVLTWIGGAQGDDRAYTVTGQGFVPVDCLYRVDGDPESRTWRPPSGQADVCAAMVGQAAELPASASTPEPPWNPAEPEVQTICGL